MIIVPIFSTYMLYLNGVVCWKVIEKTLEGYYRGYSPRGVKITFQKRELGFYLCFPTQWLHTIWCRISIGPAEQSKIEAETEYRESFCTLSGDPREKKRLRCIQNRKNGGQHISHEGGGAGESFTHPRGRSESLTSDLSLKEGNLGEGERNMSEQSK